MTRQWSYPVELKGQPYLAGESRQRLTGLGTPNEDPTFGVLVSETIQIAPPANESQPQKDAKMRQSKTVTYRNRETGVVTAISTDPNGLVAIQRTEGGLLTSVESYLAGSDLAGSQKPNESVDSDPQPNSKKATSKTAFRYDALGRRSSALDPRTGESKVVFDLKTGQVIAQLDPEQRITRYAYYPADHSSAGKLAVTRNPDGKEQHITYTPRGEQRGVWGDSVQPLLFEYNEYGEKVAMRTFQTLPNGDPSHEEDKGAKTNWQYDEATGALLKKAYADGTGPEYAYNEAGQMSSRVWAREEAVSGLAGSGLASDQDPDPAVSDSVPPKSKTANGKIATSYAYDALTSQLVRTESTDGTTVSYEYTSEGQLQKVTDVTGTREFTYDLRGQITKESVTLLTGKDTPPLTYEIARAYTTLGQPESLHLVSTPSDPDNLKPKTE